MTTYPYHSTVFTGIKPGVSNPLYGADGPATLTTKSTPSFSVAVICKRCLHQEVFACFTYTSYSHENKNWVILFQSVHHARTSQQPPHSVKLIQYIYFRNQLLYIYACFFFNVFGCHLP